MANSNHDRNLLFGILALQMDFINREQLVAAMNAWVLVKEKPLGQLLVEQKALAVERRTLLDALVQEHLKQHGDDLAKSLAAISTVDAVKAELEKINDPGLHASLGHIPVTVYQDAYTTTAPSVGDATSSGTRFRIVRPHARGGLGEVFVARDGELNREVAVKQIQIRHADNQGSRLRFVQEAEITGGLEHPGIVPVYGLGTYADGRPYYAMRFIRGDSLKEAIEDFHDPLKAAKHSTAERALELRGLLGRFIDVCDAIEYAHSRGVLHRDLKPGNIMLGKYGETLVVDWGLAKAVDRPDIDHTLGESMLKPTTSGGSVPTQMGSAIGTPQYMSPEQAGGRLDQLGPTSDVYSLGATLYSVLTGKSAFENSDIGTVLRRVESGDFPPPRQLEKSISPPLEAICLKAMSTRQADRYPSPRALAADLEHWLADEPVTAYQEPAGERVARWTRRHRAWTQSIAAAIVLVAVVAVTASLLIGRSWRMEAAAHAEAEKQRAEAERGFKAARDEVNDFFTQVSENQLLNVPGLQPLRRDLLESALGYYQDFVKQHADDASLKSELALTWYRVGRIQQQIGTLADARAALEKALPIQEDIAKQTSDAAATMALADTLNALGDLDQQAMKLDDARKMFEQARDLRQKLVDAQPTNAQFRRKLANSHNNIAVVEGELGQVPEAMKEYALANAERAKLAQENPTTSQFGRDLAQGYYNLGVLDRDLENYSAARESLGQAVTVYQTLAEKEPRSIDIQRELAVALRVLGDVQGRLGSTDEAIASCEKARNIAEPLARRNPFLLQLRADVAAVYSSLGTLRLHSTATTEALDWFGKARGIQEELAAEDSSVVRFRTDLAASLLNIGLTHQAANRFAEARGQFEQARAAYLALAKDNPTDASVGNGLADSFKDLGALERSTNHPADAIAAFQDAVKTYQQLADSLAALPGALSGTVIEPTAKQPLAQPPSDKLAASTPPTGDVRSAIAVCYVEIAVTQRADKHLDEALANLATARKVEDEVVAQFPEVAKYRAREAEAEYQSAVDEIAKGSYADARPYYEQARQIDQRLVDDAPENLAYRNALGTTLSELAVTLWQVGQKTDALATSDQATAQLRVAFDQAPQIARYRRGLSDQYKNLAALKRKAGKPTEAAVATEERRKLWPDNPGELYNAAAEFALAAAVVGDGAASLTPEQTAQRGAIVKQAIAALQEAIAAGFNKFDALREDARFKILADEPDFKKLLETKP